MVFSGCCCYWCRCLAVIRFSCFVDVAVDFLTLVITVPFFDSFDNGVVSLVLWFCFGVLVLSRWSMVPLPVIMTMVWCHNGVVSWCCGFVLGVGVVSMVSVIVAGGVDGVVSVVVVLVLSRWCRCASSGDYKSLHSHPQASDSHFLRRSKRRNLKSVKV